MQVDHPKIRQWLVSNTSGVKINTFPVFLVRRPNTLCPDIYSVSDYKYVIELARQHLRTSSDHNYKNDTSSSDDENEYCDVVTKKGKKLHNKESKNIYDDLNRELERNKEKVKLLSRSL